MKEYKVMAYVLSSGLWDAFGSIRLSEILGYRDEDLENDLAEWQALYDHQFKSHPYEFDWDLFNQMGRSLTERIKEKLPQGHHVSYEPSDDREFFLPEECSPMACPDHKQSNEIILREKKRSLLHLRI